MSVSIVPARRAAHSALALAVVASFSGIAASSAHAAEPSTDTAWNLGYDTTASTTIKKMNETSTTTGFTFSTVHLEKGTLASDLQLKNFKTPVKLGGLKIAYATIAVEPVGKATGSVNTTTHTVTQDQKAYLHITDLSATGHGLINLAGKNCRTATPVDIPVSGPFNGGFDTLKLSGTYTIPKFTGCGLISDLISKQVSGPGNTINLTLQPHA